MYDRIYLEPEQLQLLNKLVEAHRNVKSELRHNFQVLSQQGSGNIVGIIHNGFSSGSISANRLDIETLDKIDFIDTSSHSRHNLDFLITPYGFQYYEYKKNKDGTATKNIESEVKTYINDFEFKNKYETAFEKWSEADKLLWVSDTNKKLTQIGHLCRETIQKFIDELIVLLKIDTNKNKTQTVARLKIIIIHLSDKLGETEKQFLSALLSYCGSTIDLIQKQEHNALKEGEQLIWEDGRRVVFQTLIVMYEIDRSLSKFI